MVWSVWSGLVCFGLVWSVLVWSVLVWSGLVWSVLVWYVLIWLDLLWSGLIWSGLIWPDLVWSDLIWSVMFCSDKQTQQLTTSPNNTQQTVRSAAWSIHISVDIYANVKRCCVTESNHFLDRSLCRTHLKLLTKRRTRVQPTEDSLLVIPNLATTYYLVPDPSVHHPWNSQLAGYLDMLL